MNLPSPLIDRLDQLLRKEGLRHPELRAELHDHFLCSIEAALEEGSSLGEAEQDAITQIREMDLKGMNRQTFFIHHQNSILMASLCALLLTFASVFTFTAEQPELVTIDPPRLWPIAADQHAISSGFGYRMFKQKKRMHTGIDIKAPVGTPVYATESGTVQEAGFHEKKGNYVVIEHDSIYSTTYYHLSEILVKEGKAVKMGQKVGKTGNTGLSTAPHLHYEVRVNGKAVDPAGYMIDQPAK